ncbi:MAG: DUF2089 domain-containing protein [Anaerolineae bacterium]|nr:DUF2089 domain-containing protein [Anaerolineae bacterium]
MRPLPELCPICSGETEVTRIYCPRCDSTIEGHFHPPENPFRALSPEQLQFVLAFIKCEGRLNRLEEELNLSYPTLRNRLVEIIRALGFEPGKDETPVRLTSEDRRRILEDLATGMITASQAQALLAGKKEETE